MFLSMVMGKKIEECKNLKMNALLRYGTDMTRLAEMGKLDPVIGREEEIERLTQVLLKRRKNNACLVGDAGVGKTAIVEGLAIDIAKSSVPHQLRGKRVISIEMSRMLAGTKHRGQFEERMIQVVEEVRKSEGAIILFLDELHSIIMDGGGEGLRAGAPDAATILKPALARGDMKCIGATTMEEYKRCIDSDAALKRRFQSIQVSEPSREESIRILKGIKDKYQAHHGVKYTRAALIAAVDLSKHYIGELKLPDKAIDLIDEAGARAQLLGKTNVTRADIEHDVAECTGIPVAEVSAQESERLLNLEETLKRSLIGQDEAVAAVSRAIRRARVGIRDETKPIGCFLFTGPTGVGKTEMAKVVAKEYTGSEKAMVRLDMSEFMEYHTVSRLIGSPPGYHGSREGGQLTEAVRRKPHSLVLFDEIEKAHEKVLNILLQILDDGRLSDGKGRTVDFRNTIVILTSNVGGDSKELKEAFKAELLNRFDQIVVFKPLEKKHIHQILEIMVHEFRAKIATKKKVQVEVSTRLKERLILEGYNERYGARALKRAVTRLVEDKLADEILNGSLAQGDAVMMDVSLTGEVIVAKTDRDSDSKKRKYIDFISNV